MYRVFFISFVLLISTINFGLYSQELSKSDQFEQEIIHAKNDLEKIKIWIERIKITENNDPNKALKYAHDAFKMAQENRLDKEILETSIILSKLYQRKSELIEAMEYIDIAEEFSKKLSISNKKAEILFIKAEIYLKVGDYAKSSENYYKSLTIYEKLKNDKEILKIYTGISNLYFLKRNYDKSLEYSFRVYKKAKEKGFDYHIASSLNNIAAIYGEQQKFEKVIEYLKMSEEINKEKESQLPITYNYLNLCLAYLETENYKESFKYAVLADSLARKNDNKYLIASSKLNLGYYYQKNEQHKKSIENSKQAEKIATDNQYIEVNLTATEQIVNSYLELQDSISANKYLVKNYILKDSINSNMHSSQLDLLEVKHQLENKKQEAIIQKKRTRWVVSLLGISILFIIMYFFSILSKNKQVVKNEILKKERLKEKLNFKNKELALKVMSEVQQKELLTMVINQLSSIEEKSSNEEIKALVNKIYKDIDRKSKDKKVWKEFEVRFGNVHNDFYDALLKDYPELTPNELRISALLKLNMSTKEIVKLTGQSMNAVKTARYRLRKKLNITNTDTNLTTFLSKI